MEYEKLLQPLTAEIMEEADEETSKQATYVLEHQEELKKMTFEECWKVLNDVRKAL